MTRIADFSFEDLAAYNEARRAHWRRGELGIPDVPSAFVEFQDDGAWLLHGNGVWSLSADRDTVPLIVFPFGGRTRVSGVLVCVSGLVYGQYELRDHWRLDAETMAAPTEDTTDIVFSGRVLLGELVADAMTDTQLFRRSDGTDVHVGVLRLHSDTYREDNDDG